VVVVSLNYRLGALGFLAHPELSATSRSGTSGNYGLVDQQAALHWTNENIASFGGDPTKITIGGQSAGAASVIANLNSPLAKGLFNQVIAESGVRYPPDPLIGSVAQSYRKVAVAEQQGVVFLQFFKCQHHQASARPSVLSLPCW
jgi:carboxylesterase 2